MDEILGDALLLLRMPLVYPSFKIKRKEEEPWETSAWTSAKANRSREPTKPLEPPL